MCAARGLEPVVTLHHFTHPWWLGEEFWLRPGSPDVFARHVARIVPSLAPACRRWVTINEPNIVVLMGWFVGAFPPGRRMAVADAYCVLDNLLTGHVLAADAISRRAARGRGDHEHELVVGLRARPHAARPVAGARCRRRPGRRRPLRGRTPRSAQRRLPAAARRRGGAAPLLRRRVALRGRPARPDAGAAWARLRGHTRSRCAPPRRQRRTRSPHGRAAIDSVGFDWYDPVASHAMRVPGRRSPAGGRDWSFGRALWDVEPDPALLRLWCATESALRPGLPLWVVENGMATRVRDGRALPRADGLDRPRYVREHLGAVADAVADGVPVRGYLHWSLVDNYEWGPTSRASASTAWTVPTPHGCAGSTPTPRATTPPGSSPGWWPAGLRGRRPLRARPPADAAPYSTRAPAAHAPPRAAVRPGRGPASRARLDPRTRFSLRRCRMIATTMTTTIRPSRMSDAIPVAFSTRWPTK